MSDERPWDAPEADWPIEDREAHFTWQPGDVQIYEADGVTPVVIVPDATGTIFATVDGNELPWLTCRWDGAFVSNGALRFDSELDGAPAFDTSDNATMSTVLDVIISQMGNWDIQFDPPHDLPNGRVTALRFHTDQDPVIALSP